MHGESRGHKSRKSATQIMKVSDMICVVDFHDLCPANFADGLSVDLDQSFGQSLSLRSEPIDLD